MTNLIILAGIPGTGKSTWAKQFFDLKYAIVSSDKIRQEMFGGLKVAHEPEVKQQNNERVFKEFHRLITESLTHGVDVIADATNLNLTARLKLRTIAEETNSKVHLVLFKNLVIAMDRNRQRDVDSRVPEPAMEYMVRKYYDTLDSLPDESYATVTLIERYH